MSTGGFTEEFISIVPADKLFKANVVDGHKLIPKLRSETVASAFIIKGNGGAGSIRQINFTDGVPSGKYFGQLKYVKERIEILDTTKMECKLSVIEGADIGTKLQTASYHIKVEPAGNGGSVYKVALEFKTLSRIAYSDDDIQLVKKRLVGNFEAIEAFLIANPDYS